MTRGEQIRFLKDLLALCNTYGVELDTCGCDDGLKVLDDGATASSAGKTTLFGVVVKGGKIEAHTEYLDGDEFVIGAEGDVKVEPYRLCRRCNEHGMTPVKNEKTGVFAHKKCPTCKGTKRVP